LFNSNYKRRLINVIFQQDKHNINAVLKYKGYVYSAQKRGKTW